MLKSKVLKDTIWVIRSAGERTTEACRALVEEFVPSDQVRVIQEVPFSKAIKKTFQIGAESGKKWTVCLDADVLVYREGIRELLEATESVDSHIWSVQGLTIDKFIPIIRTAGNGIYRNSMVQEAMQYIPEEGTSLRPETTMMDAMIAAGHLKYRTNIVVGIHDFEQYFSDIFRKTFLHVHKHSNVLNEMLAYWEQMKKDDEDFEIALLGAEAGKSFSGTIKIDKRFRQKEWQRICEREEIKEKDDLPSKKITPAKVRDFVNTFETDMELQKKKFPEFDRCYVMWPSPPAWKKNLKSMAHRVRKKVKQTKNILKKVIRRF